MPDYTTDEAALASGLSQSINTASGILAQSNINRKTKKYNQEMYAKQRADSLADWTMQNEYNHPSSQMARLREAGLNPNLVYGKGADNTSAAVRSSDQPAWNPQAPDFTNMGGSYFADTYNFAMKQAQTDNLRVQNTVAAQEAILKAAQTANVASQTAKSQFDLGQAQKLSSISLETATAELRKLRADTDYTLHQDERAAAQNSQSIKESLQRILNLQSQRTTDKATREKIQQEIDNLQKDEDLKQLDINLKRQGVQPNDNLFFRVLGQKWQEIKKKLPTLQFRKFGELN